MSLLLLVIAFVLSGFVAIASKTLVEWNLVQYRDIYLLSFYTAPLILGACAMFLRGERSSVSDAKVGLLMGIAGASASLCMLLALASLPGIVAFPVKNLGNLVLTGMISILAWRERLSKTQWAGIILSLAAICLIY